MATKIRLARAGAKKAPFYRVVVADARSPRDGRFIEILGRYNPRTEPSTVELDVEKAKAWIAKGAQPTEAAQKIIEIADGTRTAPEAGGKKSKKVLAAEKAAADKAAEPVVEKAPAEAVAVEDTTAEAVVEADPVEEVVAEAPAEDAAAAEPAAEEAAAEEPAVEHAPADEVAE